MNRFLHNSWSRGKGGAGRPDLVDQRGKRREQEYRNQKIAHIGDQTGEKLAGYAVLGIDEVNPMAAFPFCGE